MSGAVLSVLAKSDTLVERVRAALRQALTEGAFAPGTPIKIRDIAQLMGVSPTPAREAISSLVAEGILMEDVNKTAIVPKVTHASLKEVTELRIALEMTAAKLALPLLSDEDIEMTKCYDAMIVAAAGREDMKSALQANVKFHFSIYRKLDAPLLMRMIETVWVRSGAHLAIAHNAFDVFDKTGTTHQAILDALKVRDCEAVCRAIEEDIRSSTQALIIGLNQRLKGTLPM